MSDELKPMPEPTAEEPELEPGGVDAVEVDPDGAGLPRDLVPEDNPAVEDAPDEISELDDKQQEPDGDEDAPEEPA